jgi:hypothetical protein
MSKEQVNNIYENLLNITSSNPGHINTILVEFLKNPKIQPEHIT